MIWQFSAISHVRQRQSLDKAEIRSQSGSRVYARGNQNRQNTFWVWKMQHQTEYQKANNDLNDDKFVLMRSVLLFDKRALRGAQFLDKDSSGAYLQSLCKIKEYSPQRSESSKCRWFGELQKEFPWGQSGMKTISYWGTFSWGLATWLGSGSWYLPVLGNYADLRIIHTNQQHSLK